jgi:(p)ppGpp synthase/HD superfamily hydrolase
LVSQQIGAHDDGTAYSSRLQKAVCYATEIHEVDQKQKRKGKDIPYITHPLTVGLILARAGAREDVIIAGILHDTIEDSLPTKKVTQQMLAGRFGDGVAALVASVTEFDKELSWEQRKLEALAHIENFSPDSLLVKSADIIGNLTELIDDYERIGDDVWKRFNASKKNLLGNARRVITALLQRWPQSPLAGDLRDIERRLNSIG